MGETFTEAQGVLFAEMDARARRSSEKVSRAPRFRAIYRKSAGRLGSLSERHRQADQIDRQRRHVRRRERLCGEGRPKQLPRLLARLQSRMGGSKRAAQPFFSKATILGFVDTPEQLGIAAGRVEEKTRRAGNRVSALLKSQRISKAARSRNGRWSASSIRPRGMRCSAGFSNICAALSGWTIWCRSAESCSA